MSFLLSRRSGIAALEAVVAIAMLTFIGAAGTKLLYNVAKQQLNVKNSQTAQVLGGMVVEQYNQYAKTNYLQLDAYDNHPYRPADFFNQPNMGYDRFTLTMNTTYGANKSSCTVHIGIGWQEGSIGKTMNLAKTYTRSIATNGASVRVVARVPCGGYTSDSDIINNCPPITGLSATMAGITSGTQIQSPTNNLGIAFLNNTAVGDNLSVQLQAPAGSDYSSSAFVQGYYTMVAGTPSQTITKTVSVTIDSATVLLVKEFLPAGQVNGKVIDDSDSDVTGMQVNAGYGAYAAMNGIFQPCGVGLMTCGVFTDADGNFKLQNVIPGNITLSSLGKSGSLDPTQVPGVNGSWGYMGTTVSNVVLPAAASDAAAPTVTQNVHVQHMGRLEIVAKDAITGNPVANAAVIVALPATPYRAEDLEYLSPVLTDASGKLELYNVFATNYVMLDHAVADLMTSHGEIWDQYLSNCIGNTQSLTVLMDAPYSFAGQFDDGFGGTQIANGRMYIAEIGYGDESDITAVGATFNYPQMTVITEGWNPQNPTQPFDMWAQVYGPPTLLIPATITGSITDSATNLPAAGAQFNYYTDYYATPFLGTADSNGTYSVSQNFTYYNWVDAMATCDANTRTCVNVGGSWHITTTVTTVQWDTATNSHGWAVDDGQDYNVTVGSVRTDNFTATLTDYLVQGVVTDRQSGAALAGVQIMDNNTGLAIATSGADGSYSGWAQVVNHSASSPGNISIYTLGGSVQGTVYKPSALHSITIPSPATPFTALANNNFALDLSINGGI